MCDERNARKIGWQLRDVQTCAYHKKIETMLPIDLLCALLISRNIAQQACFGELDKYMGILSPCT